MRWAGKTRSIHGFGARAANGGRVCAASNEMVRSPFFVHFLNYIKNSRENDRPNFVCPAILTEKKERAFVSQRGCGFRDEHVVDFTGVIHLGFMEYGAILPAKYGK
jgi:hypothetical protein